MPREIELRVHPALDVGPELTRRADHLRTLGFGLTLVGFGRSAGALMWLRAIAFDRVEIAATFSDNLGRSPRDKLMCAAVVDLGHRLGASVDAAGLSTEAQVSFASAVGVERGQGRYWSI
jgi:EAL domain-containing protein (putative c-di-GMP-specific phosphodiesterase class I)